MVSFEEAGGEGLFSDVQKRTKAEIIHDLAQKTLEPEEETIGTTANASVENESTEHAPRVESARVADVTQENATPEAVQEKRKNIDDAVRVAQRLFPNYTFKVYDKVTDLPENIRNGLPKYIRDYIDKNGELPEGIRVEAANDGMRTIHILADQMPSDPADIRQRIMTHEIVGHDGLKQVLGKRYDKMLDSVYADHTDAIDKIAGTYHYAIEFKDKRRLATEEWLAQNANIEDRPSWFNRLVAKIRATLRVMFNIKWSDNDIRSCFIEAARNLQEQSGSQHIRFAISDSQAHLETEAQRQYDDVVKRTLGTRLWMKAPNGQPTNLTERQWVLTHTVNFKKWFGDYELAALLENVRKTWNDDKHQFTFRFSPSEKLREALSSILGHDINNVMITDSSVKHTRNHHAANEAKRGQIDIVPEDFVIIPYLLNNYDSIRHASEYDKKGKRAIEIKKRINGVAVVTTIEEGKRSQAYVSLWIKASPALMSQESLSPEPNVQDDGGLLYKVKQDIEKIKSAAQNSSKVVDENGEPRVVYHGTEKEFWTFNNQLIGSHTDAEHDGGVGIWGRGHYFSSRSDIAEQYTRNNPDGRIMSCYLNIRNPMGQEELLKISEEAERLTEDKPELFWREYQRLIDKSIKDNGYDGVVIAYKNSLEYVTFMPNQSKSATDNVGTFSNENPDIRFSLVSDAKVKDEFQDSDKYIETYRSAMLGEDGKLYPPMATRGGEGMELGQVYRSDEHPEKINKKGKFPLKSDMRDSGKQGNVDAAYNPYFHSQPGVLNDQFSVAYDKSRMVTVKCRVLKSDLESGYWADGAKNPVGYAEWDTSGPVTKQLHKRGGRTVILSRYIMPVEIVPDSEVAKMIKEQIGDENVTIPWNVVPPNLRNELAKAGVKVGTEEEFRQAEDKKAAKRKKNVLPTKGDERIRWSLAEDSKDNIPPNNISVPQLQKAIERLLDEHIVDVRFNEDERELIIRDALRFYEEHKDMRLPLSNGGVMYFAPSPQTVERYGGDEVAAWAEYAVHNVSSNNTEKGGKNYRTYTKKKVEIVTPLIPEIVADDKTIVNRNRAVFFKQINETHIARLVAQPENGNLRLDDDFVEVTASYLDKKIPDTTMPLVRAIAEWTARGDTTNSATDKSNILPTADNANPEAPKIKPSLVAEQPTPGNPDSVDQRIYADHVAKAVAQTPIENLRAMRLPLILELARKLKGDVKAVDRIPIDGARGVFYHGSRLIEVLRELAKPQLLEKDIIVPQADVARQRQLWEDYWTKAGVPLNEIEIVETPVGGDVRMYAIRHDRTLARFRKTAGHEVGHLIDYNTGETTSHGNVLGTVGGMLKGWLMNVIGETPSTQVDKTSLNQLRRQLHKQAETMAGPKPNPADKTALDAWRQAVSDKYHELVIDECDKSRRSKVRIPPGMPNLRGCCKTVARVT